MGTITKRIAGHGRVSYQAKVRRTGFPTISKTFPEKRVAELWLAEQELSVARGSVVDPAVARGTNLLSLMDRYLMEVTPTKKGSVQESYHMRPLRASKLAAYTPATLTAQAVRQWRDARLKTAAPATVNRQLNLLHHVIEHARKEWGIGVPVNPVSDVARPKNAAGRDRRLSHGEEEKLLAACGESRKGYLRDVVQLAIETGMRQAELVGLDWRHIDLDRRTVRLLLTKNGECRTVPLSNAAARLLAGIGHSGGRVWPGLTTEGVKQSFQRAGTGQGFRTSTSTISATRPPVGSSRRG